MEIEKEKRLKDYKTTKDSPSISTLIKQLLSFTGYTISRINPPKNPQQLLPLTPEQFFDLYFSLIKPEQFFFIQLGANDGKSRDRMHRYIKKYHLRGLLVEMQPDIFRKLKENYREEVQLKFENVAIADVNKQLPFYRVKPSLVNESNFFEATAISSLNKEITKESIKKRIPYVIEKISDNLEDYIDEVEIEAITLKTLLQRNNIDVVDFLFTDCDGYDHKIINMIDFSSYKPKVINYESCVLSQEDRMQCENLLKSEGYSIFRHGNDTCAFLT